MDECGVPCGLDVSFCPLTISVIVGLAGLLLVTILHAVRSFIRIRKELAKGGIGPDWRMSGTGSFRRFIRAMDLWWLLDLLQYVVLLGMLRGSPVKLATLASVGEPIIGRISLADKGRVLAEGSFFKIVAVDA